MRFQRAFCATGLALLLALPAAAAPQGSGVSTQAISGRGASQRAAHRPNEGPGNGVGGGTFSAPEIEVALLSSAVLVVAGASLILRDRRARRRG